MLPVLEAQLREVQASIDNMIKAIEMGIITASTKERLEALEDDKKKLLSAIAIEKMEHPDIPKEFFEYWLSRLVSGDIESPEYRKMIADIFINSIYVPDDGLKLGVCCATKVEANLHPVNRRYIVLKRAQLCRSSLKAPSGCALLTICIDCPHALDYFK